MNETIKTFLCVSYKKWRKEDEWVERKFSSEGTSVYERTPVSEYRGRSWRNYVSYSGVSETEIVGNDDKVMDGEEINGISRTYARLSFSTNKSKSVRLFYH